MLVLVFEKVNGVQRGGEGGEGDKREKGGGGGGEEDKIR